MLEEKSGTSASTKNRCRNQWSHASKCVNCTWALYLGSTEDGEPHKSGNNGAVFSVGRNELKIKEIKAMWYKWTEQFKKKHDMLKRRGVLADLCLWGTCNGSCAAMMHTDLMTATLTLRSSCKVAQQKSSVRRRQGSSRRAGVEFSPACAGLENLGECLSNSMCWRSTRSLSPV